MVISGTADGREIFKSDHSQYKVKKDMELIALESIILEEFPEFFKINVNGVDYKDISGMKLASGAELDINVALSIPEDFIFGDIKIFFTLVYKDSEGNIYRDVAGKTWVSSREDRHSILKKIKWSDN